MSVSVSLFKRAIRTANVHRHKGDALTRADRYEEAREAYSEALRQLDLALDEFARTSRAPAGPLSDETAAAKAADGLASADYADLLGMRGGVLRRLGRLDEALNSYRQGAAIEVQLNLTTTYNRSNAVKLALISGDSTVADAQDELLSLRNSIEATLNNDELAAQSAWMWADLGDTYLLIGDHHAAIKAYHEFTAKARTDSPVTTLSVLREIVAGLHKSGDPAAGRVARDLARVEQSLGDSS